MRARLVLAAGLPFVALTVQWLLWKWIAPFVWFLFFPAVFFSAQLAGRKGGLIGTLISVPIVLYFFIPPQMSLAVANPNNLYSVGLFLLMGFLFGESQEQLRRAQRRIETALAETEAAKDEATTLYLKTLELDELKSQFFANLSHELRTPLTLIISPLAHRLAEESRSGEERHEDGMMLRNARALQRHVNDLLDAAKLVAGQMTVDHARFDLARMVRAMASQFEPIATERQIVCRVQGPDSLIVEADTDKVQRVLTNILSNAFKFSPDAGRIDVRMQIEQEQVVIEVEDTGPGIPADLREAIFERFRQINGGSNRLHGGTGLGLAIVKDFVKLHGGSVAVRDGSEGGALFAVRLPLRAPAGAAIREDTGWFDARLLTPASQGDASSPRMERELPPKANPDVPLILVVEDNLDMNGFIVSLLRPHYRTAQAFDGVQGLARARALRPDLILCDVMMPQMDGAQLVSELSRHPDLAEIPVIMLTAKADDNLRIHLLSSGVHDFINKPFDSDELLARVGSAVMNRKLVQTNLRRYEQLVATSSDMLAFIDAKQRFLVVNPAYSALYGITPGACHGRPVSEVIGPELYGRIEAYLERGLKGESLRFTLAARWADGRDRSLDIDYQPYLHEGVVQGLVITARDITEIKQAERALLVRETALKEAQQLAHLGSWSWSPDTQSAIWSEQMFRIFQRSPAAGAPALADFAIYFTPQSWEQVSAAVTQTVTDGKPFEVDAELLRPDGTRRWVIIRGEPTPDEAGSLSQVHGTVQDITERKRAAEALRISEERFRRLFDDAPIPLALVGRTGTMLAVNKRFTEAVGFELAEVRTLDQWWRRAYPDPHYRTETMARWEAASQVASAEGRAIDGEEYRITCKDGRIRTMLISGIHLEDGLLASLVDVTERKLMEEALRENQERMRLFIEYAPAALAMFDREMRYIAVSKRWREDYGLQSMPVIGQSHYDLFPGIPERWISVHRRALQGEVIRADEDLWQRKDGSIQWLRWEVRPWHDSHNEVGGIVIFAEDITERKVAETALRESETRFSATFNQAAMGIAMVAPDGRWLRVNRKLCEIVGYSPDEMATMSFQDITHPDDLDADLDFVRAMLAREINEYSMEKRYLRKDGTVIWINLSASLTWTDEGKPDYFIAVVEDIQRRKEAEARLQLWAESFTHAGFGLAISNARTNEFIAVNPAFAAQRGYRPEELTGRPVATVFPPELAANFIDKLPMLDKGNHAVIETEHQGKDGRRFPVMLDITVLHDEHGQVINRVVYALDITDRKRAEEEVRQLNINLERKVSERTAELQAANAELDAFAYAVSHDLRAPLRAMSGFSQALLEDWSDQLTGDARTYLDQITLASRKMGDLIDALLELSRSTRGDMRHDSVDLSALADQVVNELIRSEPERRVSISVASDLKACGDARMLEALLRNLLSNAWKYTAHTDAAEIRVFAEAHDGGTRFCVSDNGAGFAMSHAGKLFKPFQRLHRQDEFPGIGIGLATAQRIVHRHGGVMEANGELGSGARFCFTLPPIPADECQAP
jgi:PAS domain S-box-containing protein